MKEIVVEFFNLNEFPNYFEQIQAHKDNRIITFEINSNLKYIYNRLLNYILNNYELEQSTFKIYRLDNFEKQLYELKNDHDIELACFFDKYFIQICIIPNETSKLQMNQNKNRNNHHKHFDVNCNSCKQDIYGIRYVCFNCRDYNLCEECRLKGVHEFHAFVPCSTVYDYSICDDCFDELKTRKNVCLDCTRNLLPRIEKFKGNKTIQWNNYLVCDSCKMANHAMHSMRSNSVRDIESLHDKLISELKVKKLNGETVKKHMDCGNCFLCKQNGVVFQCGTLDFMHILLCDECLLNGAFRHNLTFKWLTNEEAAQLRFELYSFLNGKKDKKTTIKQVKEKSNLKSISTQNLNAIKHPFTSLNIDI